MGKRRVERMKEEAQGLMLHENYDERIKRIKRIKRMKKKSRVEGLRRIRVKIREKCSVKIMNQNIVFKSSIMLIVWVIICHVQSLK